MAATKISLALPELAFMAHLPLPQKAMRDRRRICPDEGKVFSGLGLVVLANERAAQPRTGVSPVFVSTRARDTNELSRLLDRQPRVVTELDDLGGVWVFAAE